MRRWRVGTLSLGILLIVMGIVMLAAQFNQVAILDRLLVWWPILLVLMGVEILWHVYSSKEEYPKVRYDVFSMFIIFVIVIFSIGMYGLTSTGILVQVSRMAGSRDITVEIPGHRLTIPDGVEEIVLRVPGQDISIGSTDNSEILIFGTADVFAVDREAAEALVEQGKAVTRREGSTVFVDFIIIPRAENLTEGARDVRYTLLMPRGKKVRIESTGHSNITINHGILEDIYLVEGKTWCRVSTQLTSESNIAVEAYVNSPGDLGGNAEWTIEQDTGEDGNGRKDFVKGTLKQGGGEHKLTIIGSVGVMVNRI